MEGRRPSNFLFFHMLEKWMLDPNNLHLVQSPTSFVYGSNQGPQSAGFTHVSQPSAIPASLENEHGEQGEGIDPEATTNYMDSSLEDTSEPYFFNNLKSRPISNETRKQRKTSSNIPKQDNTPLDAGRDAGPIKKQQKTKAEKHKEYKKTNYHVMLQESELAEIRPKYKRWDKDGPKFKRVLITEAELKALNKLRRQLRMKDAVIIPKNKIKTGSTRGTALSGTVEIEGEEQTKEQELQGEDPTPEATMGSVWDSQNLNINHHNSTNRFVVPRHTSSEQIDSGSNANSQKGPRKKRKTDKKQTAEERKHKARDADDMRLGHDTPPPPPPQTFF